MVVASMAALCALGASFSTSAYELNPEVKDVTPALREASTVGVWTSENPAMKNAPNKDAILVMTFGTTFKDTRAKTIDAVEKAIQEANPGVPVYEAYTSHIIIDRVKAKEGIQKLTPEEAFAKLKADGYTRVAVVSLDVIPGMEYSYDSIITKMQANNFKKLSLAMPLMYFQGTEGEPDQIVVFGADTDASPYDSGSYASSTTYVTGKAVERACGKLLEKMEDKAAELLRARYAAEGSGAADAEGGCGLGAPGTCASGTPDVSGAELEFNGTRFLDPATGESVTLTDLGTASMCGSQEALQVTETHSSPVSPPPFMAGAGEIELDKETGHVEILDYAAVVDCGTVINPNLARVQTEGGIVQGIGMALYENVQYDEKGHMMNNSFMQYKIPTRVDVGKVQVEFENSYEPNGPFGAKSIGEVVINTPLPAISDAIYNAIGTRFYELPITPEQIAMAVAAKQ